MPAGLDASRVAVEPPRDASHGDMATNAAMVLAKPAEMKPRDLAELLVAELLKSDRIETAEIAGPGFVNLRLAVSVWTGLVPHILKVGQSYGDSATGGKVNVEYVSANPTGPMHVGHARGAVFGDALARLLEKTGSEVLREYYINDAGGQITALVDSVLFRMLMLLNRIETDYQTSSISLSSFNSPNLVSQVVGDLRRSQYDFFADKEVCSSFIIKNDVQLRTKLEDVLKSAQHNLMESNKAPPAEAQYQGGYLTAIAERILFRIKKRVLKKEIIEKNSRKNKSSKTKYSEELEPKAIISLIRTATIGKKERTGKREINKSMMALIRQDLSALGVHHDFFRSERDLHTDGSVNKALEELATKGLIYNGVLEPPKGKEPPPDWEPSPQTLFKSTEFGDDSDRALKKSDGSWTYFAPDIAYHYDKFKRGYSQMIDVWGADHIGYIKRMQSATTAITGGEGQLEVKICNLVKLMRGGEPVKMSKRSGNFVTLREVVDKVGKDAVRFMMLTRKNDAPLDFDFDLVKQQSRDNPVFYVQYAHARVCSVLKNAKQAGFAKADINDTALAAADMNLLADVAEINVLQQIGNFPRILLQAAEAREPHRIAFYLGDLAGAFHALWNAGKENISLRFIQEDNREVTLARFALIRATAITLASGLDVIGVTPQDELR